MGLTIVVLDNQEQFLQFLDPDLCSLEETIEYGGLRTLNFTYTFQDLVNDKELFRIGNKIWVQGDTNLQDCLYVINTEVTQDIYDKNTFELELEEVLVELNYAPLFSQTELTANSTIFHLATTNGNQEVIVDWNSLNYWFGSYFNIGVVQNCISNYASRISVTGTINRMTLLRNIEEETGNVFVTRYEKDCLDNTIHRYLDFLNPINCNKDWTLNLEYDFEVQATTTIYDENDNETADDKPWEVTRFQNTAYDEETITENTNTDDEEDYDVEIQEEYDTESNEIYEFEEEPEYTPIVNIDPTQCVLRITDGENLLNTDGTVYQDGDTALSWSCSELGMVATNYPSYLISLVKTGDILGVTVNNKSFVVAGVGADRLTYLPDIKTLEYNESLTIAADEQRAISTIPDDSYFEIYNTTASKVLFSTRLNSSIGHVHEEILDFGFNLDNIVYDVDETDTYTAITPVIQPNNENNAGKTLSRNDIDTIINRWIDLGITKGAVVPMIVEKINVTSTGTWQDAASSLGNYDPSNPYESTSRSNYWIRPLKPNDNTDGDSNQYEFYRATSYWKAPFTKHAGELHVSTDKVLNIDYTNVYSRPDTRDERICVASPKLGNTETSDEDKFMIYNQVCEYLKEHETPSINVEVDVANLRGYEYNNYNLHDKIYIKLANTKELITSRITKTTKEAHDIAKNTIEINNYNNINTVKTLTHATYIDSSNTQFMYPNSQTLVARLINNEPDQDTDTYLANKLLTFTLYKIENSSPTLTSTVYTKLTDAYGYASIDMKYDPGDYEIEISFMGDEQYEESSLTVSVNVGGVIPVPTPVPVVNETKSKTTNKTETKTKTEKIYWTKCGLGPKNKDGVQKKIVSIAKPSGTDANKYSYKLYKTVFKNYCPICKRWGTLRFDGGKSNKCITSAGAHGRGYKLNVPEHEITCNACDSDFCGVTGIEKWIPPRGRLKTVEKPVASSKTEFKKLVKGKLLYGTKEIKVKSKKNTNTKERKIRASGIQNDVKKLALSIVKDKTGRAAMDALVSWWTKNMAYHGYSNFVRSPSTVIKKGGGNCCDGTRAFFTLCDAAGLCQYYEFYYVHVQCPKWGHVYGKIITKKTKKWRYFDSVFHKSGSGWGKVTDNCPHGSGSTKYPKLPF